jgi:hypothetical protein
MKMAIGIGGQKDLARFAGLSKLNIGYPYLPMSRKGMKNEKNYNFDNTTPKTN